MSMHVVLTKLKCRLERWKLKREANRWVKQARREAKLWRSFFK